MIVTQQKPQETILKMLEKEHLIFVVSCNGCAETCKTGGEKVCKEVKIMLENNGKKVVSCCNIDFMCNKLLVKIMLSRYKEKIENSDAILGLTCGIGIQTLATVITKKVYPANDTIYLGGYKGLWPAEERCGGCGDCILHLTGGICPVTKCSKSLLNGPCGGAKNGKCEVDKTLDCGWEKIFNKLKQLDSLKNVKDVIRIRDYSKMIPSQELRNSSLYNIEK